jgi:ribose 5-phosphate isomerase RpiB
MSIGNKKMTIVCAYTRQILDACFASKDAQNAILNLNPQIPTHGTAKDTVDAFNH